MGYIFDLFRQYVYAFLGLMYSFGLPPLVLGLLFSVVGLALVGLTIKQLRGPKKPRLYLPVLGAILSILGVAILLMVLQPYVLQMARALSLLLTGAGLVMVVIAIKQMRRPTRLRWYVPVLGMAFSVLGSLGYLAIMRPPVNLRFALILVTLGLILGILQGRQTRMYWQDDVLMAQRTTLYVGLWGFAYVATQLLAQLQSAALHAVGILTMMFSIGIAVGSNLNLASRQHWMRSRGPRQ